MGGWGLERDLRDVIGGVIGDVIGDGSLVCVSEMPSRYYIIMTRHGAGMGVGPIIDTYFGNHSMTDKYLTTPRYDSRLIKIFAILGQIFGRSD
jgi:hypothetical protein